MNWMQKFQQNEAYEMFGDVSEWNEGDIAILSIFGWKDFAVIKAIDWDDIGHMSDRLEVVDRDKIKSDSNMTWTRGEVVPCQVQKTYGEGYAKQDHYQPGNILMVGPQNLYRTIHDLIEKELKIVYPDLVLQTMNEDHIHEAIRDFPQLGGEQRIPEHVNYEQFQDSRGYTIQVFQDPRAYVGYGREEAEFPYYWYIPDLKVRSLDLNQSANDPKMRELIQSVWSRGGSFRYHTVQEAADAAEKYLDYMFPEEPETVT